MKTSDNPAAKYEFWARAGKVCRLPVPKGLPPFASRRFDSYEEFNAWKQDRLRQIASQGGVTWTK
jgi:hypothetical protein